jgi:lipopolysaccharide/colanic/teichoic acid biosynthesis glycosyltransferase
MSVLRLDKASKSATRIHGWLSTEPRDALDEKVFKRMIAVERKRTERSREPFLLMLLEASDHCDSERNHKALTDILSVLPLSVRATDVVGWYKDRTTVGAMFTGLARNDKNSLLIVIVSRVSATLREHLPPEEFNNVNISFHFFPDEWDHNNRDRPSNPMLYPDLVNQDHGAQSLLRVKRAMDLAGSISTLILCSPLFALIALVIKLSSKGPVFFRQERIGQYGRSFTFLKFRSMHVDSDQHVHQEYVTRLINGQVEDKTQTRKGKGGVYKLTNDKRVTAVGKLLRRTSMDELPQLLNVLHGDMSLVGPRPPIPYELLAYQTWHRRRVLDVKPGITGLWQVSGRSSVKFDEMVRLDLRYATSWTPWLDVLILMRTPRAVITGAGAC